MLPQTEVDTIKLLCRSKTLFGIRFSTFCHFVLFKMFKHSSAPGMQIRFAILSIDLQAHGTDRKGIGIETENIYDVLM